MKKIALISLIFVFIDQIVKIIISSNIELGSSIEFIHNFLSLTYVVNIGAAFGILGGGRLLFVITSFIALSIIYFYFIKKDKLNNLKIFTYSLLIGGIIGNMLDRLFRGYVIDYFDFNLFGYDYPIFNLADTFIIIGAVLFVIILPGGENRENNSNRK